MRKMFSENQLKDMTIKNVNDAIESGAIEVGGGAKKHIYLLQIIWNSGEFTFNFPLDADLSDYVGATLTTTTFKEIITAILNEYENGTLFTCSGAHSSVSNKIVIDYAFAISNNTNKCGDLKGAEFTLALSGSDISVSHYKGSLSVGYSAVTTASTKLSKLY